VPDRPPRWRRWAGDFSGAFADLGTFLPLIIGVFAVQQLDPTGVLIGFGVFALAVALLYRRPVPVQPMKAVAAVVIAGGLSASDVAATGLLLGLVLVVLGLTGAVGRLARVIPQPVLMGIQLGVGLYLAWAGARLVIEDPVVGGVAVAALLLLQRTFIKPLAALFVVAAAGFWGASRTGIMLPSFPLGLSLPEVSLPDWGNLWTAFETILVPQLALTVTNAALITAAIAAELFPEDQARITSDRLALTSGALNIVLAPIGAFPMCHGAGGLVVQHRFGARTGLAPALFGIACLSLGALFGPDALGLLAVLPLAAVGALLVIAGTDLAYNKRLRRSRPDGLVVIFLTGLTCVIVNVAAGLVTGIFLELARAFVMRRHPPL
jgi:SulP family sulfate permease